MDHDHQSSPADFESGDVVVILRPALQMGLFTRQYAVPSPTKTPGAGGPGAAAAKPPPVSSRLRPPLARALSETRKRSSVDDVASANGDDSSGRNNGAGSVSDRRAVVGEGGGLSFHFLPSTAVSDR